MGLPPSPSNFVSPTVASSVSSSPSLEEESPGAEMRLPPPVYQRRNPISPTSFKLINDFLITKITQFKLRQVLQFCCATPGASFGWYLYCNSERQERGRGGMDGNGKEIGGSNGLSWG
uniref:Uncharacterized protein n=1 Tax=Nelumbo nucifera TaxID=4432 RepID=A0A822XS62_NELNU|nr:TPA_asm: hypothetical protein HUJ06_023382 [Nelumbo nucifera]